MPLKRTLAFGLALLGASLSMDPAVPQGLNLDLSIPSVALFESKGAAAPPPSCTADGKTDWSNACDLPLLAGAL